MFELNYVKDDDIILWRRDLHQIPEIGLDLPMTTEYVRNLLTNWGVPFRMDFSNHSSILAIVRGEKEDSSKGIAIRADMDGLPICEATDLEFASKNGNMHACGHDGHVAMLLGALFELWNRKEEFSGTIHFLFQPAEEINQGAKPLIEGGALEGMDFILGLHNGCLSKELKPGQLGFKSGALMACMDKFVIEIEGKGSHGAYPHQSIDPIISASEMIIALQSIISREVIATEPVVISVCMIEAGSAFNIIPDKVTLTGTARAVSTMTRDKISSRIGEIAKGIGQAHGTKIRYHYYFGPPPLVNDIEITQFVKNVALDIFDKESVQELKQPVMPGEDFAYYLEEIPGAFIFLENPLEINGEIYPHHNPLFALDEQYLIKGTQFIVAVALEYLN